MMERRPKTGRGNRRYSSTFGQRIPEVVSHVCRSNKVSSCRNDDTALLPRVSHLLKQHVLANKWKRTRTSLR